MEKNITKGSIKESSKVAQAAIKHCEGAGANERARVD